MKSRDEARSRRYLIMETVAKNGTLSFDQIRQLIRPKKSDPTLRKDIDAILKLPIIRENSDGDLVAQSKGLFENTYFGVNRYVETDKKEHIAQRLIEGNPPFEGFPLINLSGDTLVVGPGSTTLAVMRVLAKYPGVEILTTNLGVLEFPDLLTKPSIHLSGGWCLYPVGCLVGRAAIKNIEDFVANLCIVGVSGIAMLDNDEEVRFYCHHEAQLPVKEALIQGRKNIIIVTCGSKLNRQDAWEFATASQILRESNLYIVIDSASEDLCEKLRSRLDKLCDQISNNRKAKLIELKK